MNIYFKKLHEEAKIPTKVDPKAEGFDVYTFRQYFIQPRSVVMVETGIASTVDEDHWIQIEGRSGMASKGVFPIGGVLDKNYTGEIKVILVNMGSDCYEIKPGDRIAQFVIRDSHSSYNIVEVSKLDSTDRGDKGFGSSGK